PFTVHLPDEAPKTIYDASVQYQAEAVPLVVLAGKEYGSGSSRDWGAKGPRLLGVRVVIAESYERIHRSNLVGMGILPLQFQPDRRHVLQVELSIRRRAAICVDLDAPTTARLGAGRAWAKLQAGPRTPSHLPFAFLGSFGIERRQKAPGPHSAQVDQGGAGA